jgi:NADH-quinone oxidoreductase subunit N
VYAGSPTRITAFMSTVIKVGALAAFFRFFVMAMGMVHPIYKDIVLSLGVLSIVFGNIIAVTQSNVKRLLAFSGISHAGFVFLAISVLTPETSNVVIYYLASYSVSGIALFWVAVELSKQNITTIPEYKGLIQKNKLLTITLIISLLSMAGIPPFAGFFAKYNVLVQLFIGNKFWVALVGILTSLIAVYYYFKLIISSVQTKDQEKVELIKLNLISKVFLVLLNLIIIGLGLFYNIIIKYI